MNFELNEEQQMVKNSVREFAVNEIATRAREYDEAEKFPREQLDGLAELGMLGMIIPEEYGGAGFDTVSYSVALEEIWWGAARGAARCLAAPGLASAALAPRRVTATAARINAERADIVLRIIANLRHIGRYRQGWSRLAVMAMGK